MAGLLRCILQLSILLIGIWTEDTVVEVCDEQNNPLNWFIYCQGPLLESVNIHGIFNDSKTFVDMPMSMNAKDVNASFYKEFGNTEPAKINKTQLEAFLDKHFSEAGTELIHDELPPDWSEKPEKLMTIVDDEMREFALELNKIWKILYKQINSSITADPSRYSLLFVPNPFIAPGGRFREFYYWDAYWIVKGLIACGMYNTTQGMIDNFATMVDQYGFVPNGGRVYYLRRSQPPLLSGMVYEYYEATKDKAYIQKILPTLEKELLFWEKNRQVTVTINNQPHLVYQYRSESNVPRPESYAADIATASTLNKTGDRQFFQNMASAAESGWDFSTRWFADNLTLNTIETTNVVPIDLNSYIHWNFDILEYLYSEIGDSINSAVYGTKRLQFRETMRTVFYDDQIGCWFDYNLRTKSLSRVFYPSIAAPLFTAAYNKMDESKAERVYKYIKDQGVFEFVDGIPTSLIQNSSQQWDFPNGWSPLNHIVAEGLRKSGNAEMQEQAFLVSQRWILGNYEVFKTTKHMYEKYDVTDLIPAPGNGGEYVVQDGFGWTNGVILDLLVKYNDRIKISPSSTPTTTVPPKKNGIINYPPFMLIYLCLILYVLF